MNPTRDSRLRGALLGLAAGDAVGTAVEFAPPGSFPPVTDMVGGGVFRLRPGEWTDDTSMALCLADSLIECSGFDPRDQMERYLRWRDEGYLSSTGSCFDIGYTISAALEGFRRSGDPFSGSTDPRSAGNGSIMRLAPVPLYFMNNPRKAVRLSAESSRTTHGTRTCLDACRYFGGLLVGACRGAGKDLLLSDRYTPVEGMWAEEPLCSEIDEVASGSFKHREPPEIVGSGYVARSLEAALWSFFHSSDFREGCLLAVNLGDDADTTAAVYGQLAGAYYGEEGIPVEWRGKLAMADRIIALAEGLARGG